MKLLTALQELRRRPGVLLLLAFGVFFINCALRVSTLQSLLRFQKVTGGQSISEIFSREWIWFIVQQPAIILLIMIIAILAMGRLDRKQKRADGD